jgi:hypothetical protein
MFGAADLSRLNPLSACRFLALMLLMAVISCMAVISFIPRMPAYCRTTTDCSRAVLYSFFRLLIFCGHFRHGNHLLYSPNACLLSHRHRLFARGFA